MADLISEDAEHTSAPETTELSGATLDRENAEPNKIAALMLSIWNAVMIACTMALFLMAMVLKDKSDATYATIGFIGLCIPQAVKFLREWLKSRDSGWNLKNDCVKQRLKGFDR